MVKAKNPQGFSPNGTYEILGKAYPIVGYVTTAQTGLVPLVDLPMMSDERWNELYRESAVKHYTAAFGHAPDNVEAALKWEQEEADRAIRKRREK